MFRDVAYISRTFMIISCALCKVRFLSYTNHDHQYLFPPGSFLATPLFLESITTDFHGLAYIFKPKTEAIFEPEIKADAFWRHFLEKVSLTL